uniref:Major facilitator superfamily (MFS) profile domain-containing protein n=1 Tax=Alexandrium monilatum TaxID=311494 RepID=A0A7S4Q5S0_9DINO
MKSASCSSTDDAELIDPEETTPLVSKEVQIRPRERSPILESLLAVFGISSLADHFGHKLLIMLIASQHLMKGFALSFMSPCILYLYRSYQVRGPQMQIFAGVAQLPWAMKPVIGLISDALPIRGLHKAPYILFASFFGIFATASVGAAPKSHMTIGRLVGCLFLIQMQFSTCDLLTEAKYAEQMQSRPEHGPALMTFVWFGLQVGGLAATVFIGPTLQRFGPKVPYLIALLPLSFIVVPVARNYLEEVPKTSAQVALARRRLFEQKEACFLCLLMFLGTITLTCLGIFFESAAVNAVASLMAALVMLGAFSVLLKPIIAKVNAFFLVQTSLGFSIAGASFYFYTDTPEQYPEGPHFSQEFFTSVLGTAGSIFSLIGICTYQRFASNWTYRGLLLISNIMLSLLSVTDIILFTRLNVHFGIPDHLFVLGASVLTSAIAQWMWMPGVVILSQLCPKGMEATMYALLAGCHNLGTTVASNCGAWVLELLGCQPTGALQESKQFDRLWVGSALSIILPTITVALLPWLIPDARQTDKLLEDGDRDATAGSLWKRWMEAS